jgi:hypothetical protein
MTGKFAGLRRTNRRGIMKKYGSNSISLVLVVVLGLFCCLSLAGEEQQQVEVGKIEAGKPQYVKKDNEAWKVKGRIVGIAKAGPDFTVTILDSSKQKVKTVSAQKLKKGGRAYEVWLKPGTYILLIQAPGYQSLDLKDLKVKAGFDLKINLEFTKQT